MMNEDLRYDQGAQESIQKATDLLREVGHRLQSSNHFLDVHIVNQEDKMVGYYQISKYPNLILQLQMDLSRTPIDSTSISGRLLHAMLLDGVRNSEEPVLPGDEHQAVIYRLPNFLVPNQYNWERERIIENIRIDLGHLPDNVIKAGAYSFDDGGAAMVVFPANDVNSDGSATILEATNKLARASGELGFDFVLGEIVNDKQFAWGIPIKCDEYIPLLYNGNQLQAHLSTGKYSSPAAMVQHAIDVAYYLFLRDEQGIGFNKNGETEEFKISEMDEMLRSKLFATEHEPEEEIFQDGVELLVPVRFSDNFHRLMRFGEFSSTGQCVAFAMNVLGQILEAQADGYNLVINSPDGLIDLELPTNVWNQE